MTEDMKVRVELWPVAADEHALWLLSGNDAWRSPNVPADSEPHAEVERLLVRFGEIEPALIHSTSWRPDGPAVLLTYVAVYELPDRVLALDLAPDAKPITLAMLRSVGKPWQHTATEAPTPRYIDVLEHGLGHLTLLRVMNSTVAEALRGTRILPFLETFEPTLAGLYQAA